MKACVRFLISCIIALAITAARADLKIASLSTVTTDLARQVGGTNVTVDPIIATGVDPHEFEPTPGDIRKVAEANLVLFTGKGMEGYLTKLEDASGNPGKFLDVGRSIPSLTTMEEGRSVEDPHWWHGVENMKRATRSVASAFARADPPHAAEYRRNADSYLAQLDDLGRWIRVTLAGLPKEKRKLVTSHDALGYFAHDYGFVIYPIKGVSTAEEPSSKNVRDIIEVIRREGVKAVFFENVENPRAIAQISSETGAVIGGGLCADGLGTGDSATYTGMMKHNVTTIVSGLK
jgi:zinc/manganese transport system substrate-binding protein